MTYLDLLTELQSFDDDLLLKEVTVYDTSKGEYSPVGAIQTDKVWKNEYFTSKVNPYLEF